VGGRNRATPRQSNPSHHFRHCRIARSWCFPGLSGRYSRLGSGELCAGCNDPLRVLAAEVWPGFDAAAGLPSRAMEAAAVDPRLRHRHGLESGPGRFGEGLLGFTRRAVTSNLSIARRRGDPPGTSKACRQTRDGAPPRVNFIAPATGALSLCLGASPGLWWVGRSRAARKFWTAPWEFLANDVNLP
jgi:hypothetical protein